MLQWYWSCRPPESHNDQPFSFSSIVLNSGTPAAPLSGGLLYFYKPGTDTPKDTYSDNNLTVPNANPVVLSSSGLLPNVFLDGAYRVILQDKNGVQQPGYPRDSVNSLAQAAFATWDSTISYGLGGTNIVYASNGTYYISIQAANLGHEPSVSPLWCEPFGDFIVAGNLINKAKGSLLVGDGTEVVALAVGSDDEVLIADSGETAGIRWGALPNTPLTYVARTSNTIITTANNSSLFDYTSGTFSQTFDPCADLGAGWFSWFKNTGTGVVTLDPDGGELIGGVTTAAMNPGDIWLVSVNSGATALILERVAGMNRQIYSSSSGNFTVPAGVYRLYGECVGGGAGVANSSSTAGGAGGYCAGWINTTPGATIAYAVGGGGNTVPSAGGNTTFGSLTANGGAVVSGSIGAGGSASGGDINIAGGSGIEADNATIGGASPIGSSAIGVAATTSTAGVAPGGGAAGGAASGASGAAGIIVITWT